MIELTIYGFLLMFNSNIGKLGSFTIYKALNLSVLEFDVSQSLKVKCDGAIGLLIYGFLLMFYSNIGSN